MRRLAIFGWISLVGVVFLSAAVLAAAPAYALPPRPTNTPPPADKLGGRLVLQTYGAPAAAWTGVQWLDALGQWQAVPGWQGTLDEAGRVEWYVAPPEGGQETFRWVVWAKRGGAVWAMSGRFALPASGDLKIVTLPEPTATPPAAGAAAAYRLFETFVLASQGVRYQQRAAGCDGAALGGRLIDPRGNPWQGAALRIWLMTPSGQLRSVLTGAAPARYPWEFEFLLPAPLETGTYQVQVRTPDKQALSLKAAVEMQAGCERNLGWVVFQATGR